MSDSSRLRLRALTSVLLVTIASQAGFAPVALAAPRTTEGQAQTETAAPPDARTELIDARTETSETFDNHDGTLTMSVASDPIFYRPDGSPTFEPIELGFAPVAGSDKAVRSDKAPVELVVAPADDPRGIVALTHGERRIALLPVPAEPGGRGSGEAAIDGRVADVTDAFPGIDLRVVAYAYGVSTYLVVDARPASAAWTFEIDAPGLTLVARRDGSLEFVDEAETPIGLMPAPYAVDSTPDELTGSGRMTTAVSYALGRRGERQTVTVSVNDGAWLDSAVYPIYVDPAVTIYSAGSSSYGDAHVNQGNPTFNYANYQRPDSPYYDEMWLGESPTDSTYYNEAFIKFQLTSLDGMIIDVAELQVYPYHQYYNAPTATNTWLRRVTAAWQENTITWNNKPTVTTTGTLTDGLVEGTRSSFIMTSMVQDWAAGTYNNYGLRLDENGNGPTYWKRLISSEYGSVNSPRMNITYHAPTPPAAPSTPNLLTASDTGISTSDDITKLTTPTFNGTGEVAATVTLYSGANPVGSDTVAANGNWSIVTSTLGAAVHSMTAKATDAEGSTGPASAGLSVTIDPTAPPAPTTPDLITASDNGPSSTDNITSVTTPTFTVTAEANATVTLYAGVNSVGSAGFSGGTWTITSSAIAGVQSMTATATDVAGNTGSPSATGLSVTIDTVLPAGAIAYPEAGRALAGDIVITGSATDATSFQNYQLEYGAGITPGSWTTIGTFTSQVTGTNPLATWVSGTLNGAYTLRLTVRDLTGNPSSVTDHLVYLENAERGDEAYQTRVPFDLGGGWGLDVGVSNGEARLSRDLFSIPSFGPPQELGLTYSSLETGTAGKFGVGWTSNLTQYLTFESGFVVWHRADGGRVPFGSVASVWTPLRGHFEVFGTGTGTYTVTLKDQTKLTFENSGGGRLTKIENRFGKYLSLAWSASSATATDASGRVTTLAIDSGNNRITGATDSAGRAWSFGYTGTDLTSVTDPASKVTALGYDGSHRLTSVIRSRSRVTGSPETLTWAIGYTSGKATSVTDPVAASIASTFTYVAGSTDVGILTATSPSVARDTTTYDFDALGRVTEVTDPEGYVTTTTYDADSNATVIAMPIGTGTTQSNLTYTFDARGNVLSETVPIDGSTSVSTVKTYNATNDLLTRTDADNDTSVRTVTRYSYDGAFHLAGVNVNCTTSGTTPPTQGQGGTCTGAGTQDAETNLITSYAYTANHQLAFEEDPLGRVTKYTYDGDGNQTGVTRNCTTSGTASPSPFSSCTGAGTADAQTNVTTTQTFDAATTAGKAGLATKTTDALVRDTTFTYDALGRQLTEVSPSDASIPALTRTTTYDELGNVLTDADSWTPLGGGGTITQTTSHAYDLANRRTSMTDPASVTVTTTWDLAGRALSTTSGGVTTSRTFDGLGRTLSETVDGGTTDRTYDGQGNEIETDPPASEPTTRAFTRTGWLLTEILDPTGLALGTTKTYDRLGRELTSIDPASITTAISHDRLGRRLSSQVTSGPLITTTYDRAGNAVAVKGADGMVTASLVDPLDRVVTTIANCTNSGTTVPAAGATCAGTGTANNTTNVTTRTFLDASGTTIAVTDAEGITFRTITNVRYLAKQTFANCTDSGTTPTSTPPACVGAGTPNATTNVQTTITYDGPGAVATTVTAVGTGAAATTNTAYDAAGRIQAVKDPLGTITRSFYTTGRLIKTVVNCTTSGTTIPTDWVNCSGAGTQDGTHNLTTTYGYDAAGNQTSVVGPNGRETRMTHDDDGRVVTRTDNYVNGSPGTTDDLVTTSFYDDAGRQTAVKAPTIDGNTFAVTRSVYNADGRLWKEIRGCTDTGTSAPSDPGACAGTGTANAETNVVTEYDYDSRGNRTRLITPDPSSASGTASGTVTGQYAFDAADRLCRVVENATGSTNLQTLTTPCSDATQTSATTSTNVSTRYTYDGAGNLASMIDANGGTTTYAHDATGRLTSLTDPLSNTISYVYNDLGQKIREDDRTDAPATGSVSWTYDGAGRVLDRIADSATTTYTYDANGNKLTATAGSLVITATYDRLNRVLTVDDEDAGSTADTTYAYHLTSPSWTDPNGMFAVTLDVFDRVTALDDPANGTDFAWTYRADGQPASFGQPNGNTTAFAHDALGHLTSKDTTATGPTNRALYDWTYNRAGQVLTEASTLVGDPDNGVVTYGYDALGRLTGSTVSATTTAYGWDTVPNRTSVQVGGGTAATTTYDAANRPTSGANPTAAYTSDSDGRLTARPGQTLEWDHLGRLTAVKNAAGTVTLASYTYDPLDRLRTADDGTDRIRFRYVGLTTSAAQWLDDVAGTVTRKIGTGWTGERLLDWTGSSSNIRIYGENAHHDATWLASSSGSVSQALRYDPWGTPRSTAPVGYTPFRFQGSWHDVTTDLSWVVTRWYAPSLGRFVSEDSLLGDPIAPPTRHLYAYGAAEPVGRWDPDGRRFRIRLNFVPQVLICTGHTFGGRLPLIGQAWAQAFTSCTGNPPAVFQVDWMQMVTVIEDCGWDIGGACIGGWRDLKRIVVRRDGLVAMWTPVIIAKAPKDGSLYRVDTTHVIHLVGGGFVTQGGRVPHTGHQFR